MRTIKVGKGETSNKLVSSFLLAYFRSKNVNLDFKLRYYGLTNAIHFFHNNELRKKIWPKSNLNTYIYFYNDQLNKFISYKKLGNNIYFYNGLIISIALYAPCRKK